MNSLADRRTIMQLRILISSDTQHGLLSKRVIFLSWPMLKDFFARYFFFQQIFFFFFFFFYQTSTSLHCVSVCLFFNGNFPSPPNLKIENIAPHNLMSKHKMCALTSFLSHSAFLHPSIILIVLPFVDRLRAFLSALFLGAAKGSGYQQSE